MTVKTIGKGKLQLVLMNFPVNHTRAQSLIINGKAEIARTVTERYGKVKVTYALPWKSYEFKGYSIPTWSQIKHKAITFWRTHTPCPVYYWYSSTDCDQTHVEYAVKFKNGEAAQLNMEKAYEDCEGETYFSPITKKQYDSLLGKPVTRNYAEERAGY